MAAQNTMSILRVLTVDDSPVIAERLQTILAQIEQVVFVGNATNMAAALSSIERQQPHVVILDINLKMDIPKLNGINLLMMLRKKYFDIKIIMLTNLTDVLYRDTCLFLGADYFLDKSNEFEKIADILGGFTKIRATDNLDNHA